MWSLDINSDCLSLVFSRKMARNFRKINFTVNCPIVCGLRCDAGGCALAQIAFVIIEICACVGRDLFAEGRSFLSVNQGLR